MIAFNQPNTYSSFHQRDFFFLIFKSVEALINFACRQKPLPPITLWELSILPPPISFFLWLSFLSTGGGKKIEWELRQAELTITKKRSQQTASGIFRQHEDCETFMEAKEMFYFLKMFIKDVD